MSQDNDAPFDKLDLESLFNVRQWFKDAIEAKGAKVIGAGIGMKGDFGMADIDVEIEDYVFNLEITPRTVQPTRAPLIMMTKSKELFCTKCKGKFESDQSRPYCKICGSGYVLPNCPDGEQRKETWQK